jgi:hypothetical protein
METQFENYLDQVELRKQIEMLESKVFIYSDRDRVRMNELVSQIKELEIKLLDLMVQSAIID